MIKICIIGAGYVGAITGIVMASQNPVVSVTIVDIDEKRIQAFQLGTCPFYEPGLATLLHQVMSTSEKGRLTFSTDISAGISLADVVIIAVNTPGTDTGFVMDNFFAVCRTIAHVASGRKVIVEKSTVPVRTAERIREIFLEEKEDPSFSFQIVSNPEFLAEGTAVADLLQPNRVLIGGADVESMTLLAAIYSWVPKNKIIFSNVYSAELAKLASNVLLAQRISSINALSAICEETGADVRELTRILGSDDRIGPKYLQAGIGFGGSCLRKDVQALCYLCRSLHLPVQAAYFEGILAVNRGQVDRVVSRIRQLTRGKAEILILGYAFKGGTSDPRESPCTEIIQNLKEGNRLTIYDPKVDPEEIRKAFPELIISDQLCPDVFAVDLIVVLTDWPVFLTYDYTQIYQEMRKRTETPTIFDGRNFLDWENLTRIGFTVVGVGA